MHTLGMTRNSVVKLKELMRESINHIGYQIRCRYIVLLLIFYAESNGTIHFPAAYRYKRKRQFSVKGKFTLFIQMVEFSILTYDAKLPYAKTKFDIVLPNG